MSELTVFNLGEDDAVVERTSDGARIAEILNGIGIRFERWKAGADLPANADNDAVLTAYGQDIERLKSEDGYQTVDVLRVTPDIPNPEELRNKFLQEHTHTEDEVRFFVEGSGLFFIRTDDNVYRVLCERDDLISVPAGTRHWFDATLKPHFTAIRLFIDPKGWVADYTGDKLASRFEDAA